MKTAQTATGALTKVLLQLQQEFEMIDEAFREVLRTLEGSKADIVATTVAAAQAEVSDEEKGLMEAQVEENMDEAFDEIQKARSIVGRLSVLTRNSAEMSRRTEKTWKDTLKDLIRDTKWYRENFPAEYEERRRKKEYERYRMRPEFFHTRPWAGEHKDKAPELEDVRVRSFSTKLNKTAQLESIASYVEELFRRLFQVVQTYFGADSPILEASNHIVSRIKGKMGRQLNEAVAKGLKDQVQVLENLFGFERQPGRFIVSGGRAFILPAIKRLQEALEILQNPMKDVGEYQEVGEELSQRYQTDNGAAAPAPAPVATPGEALSSRMKNTLERFGRVTERQKRCHILQRIASSR